MGLAHPYDPAEPRSQLVVDCLVRSLDSKATQRHLLIVDTSKVAGTVHIIEAYLAVGSSDCPVCKAVGEKVEPSKLNQPTTALAAQSEMPSAQSGILTVQMEAVTKVLARL